MDNKKLDKLSLDEKRLLLMKALQKKSGATEEAHPLSLFQEGLLFLSRLQPGSIQYNMPHVIRLYGKLDQAVLERSMNEIIRRHAPLRTVFTISDEGQPQQIVKPFQPQPLTVVDLSTLPIDRREGQAMQIVQEEGRHVFDLANESLLRYQLIRLHEDEHWFLFVAHHIIFDLLSLEVFLKELGVLYGAFVSGQESPLADPAFSYPSFARRQRQWLQGEVFASQLAYWQQKLGGSLPVLELPTDHPRPAEPSGKGALYTFSIPEMLTAALNTLGRQEGATLFMTLLAAFNVLLHRYTHQDDILIGTPVANRNRAEMANLIGLLINTLVLRTDLSGAPTFRQFLKRVQETALDAYSHQDVPFPKLVEIVQPDRSGGRTPIFQVLFALENASVHLEIPGLETSLLDSHHGTAKFDLSLMVKEEANGLTATFEYSTDLFEEATICRMANHFVRLLASIVENPNQSITTLSLLSPEELEQLLVRWNDTAMEYPRQYPVHELVHQHAQCRPHAIAVVAGNNRLTYAEFNRRADQLASYLRANGVGPDVLVGICMDRSLDMIVSILGVLKAGGAYVPMDPAHPKERLAFLVEDSQAEVVLTHQHLLSRLPGRLATYVCLDTDWEDIARARSVPDNRVVKGEHLAYMIYTSGSTGKPKGVGVTHDNLLNLVYWSLRTYQMTAEDRCSQICGAGFDASVWEIWSTLCAGASLYLVGDETRLSPQELRDWLLARKITRGLVPTPLAEELLVLSWPTKASLRHLFIGGDKLHSYPRPEIPFTLVNLYGPTECTVLVTATIVPSVADSERLPSLGRPIANTQLYVLDRNNQVVPVGVPGELHVGGSSVSRGYHRRPELTPEKFIPNPLSKNPTDRLYKTGDLVRYLPDGNIEFLGRIDQQVKIRGHRIELKEIEAALIRHSQVHEAVVLANEVIPSDYRLVAYIVTHEQQAPADTELRSFLKEILPEYMVPAIYVVMDAFPLTPNGKIDRHALASVSNPPTTRPSQSRTTTDIPAGTSIEQALTSIWKEVLGRHTVGLHDNFFDLGGHSLLLIRLHEKICKTLKADIQLLELFKYPTIGALAQRIQGQPTGLPQVAWQEESTDMCLSSNQSSETDTDIAVIGMAGRFPGANDIETFWENLRDGVESIRWFSREELQEAGADLTDLDDPNFVPVKGIMEGADLFDAAFFGISPREAETIDPQQRVLLECAWEALEHAGYNPERYAGRIGVYAGSSLNTYLLNNLYPNKEHIKKVGMYQVLISNDKDFLTTRVAYKLDLKGPAVTVQTACSTSLVAIHMACQSLLSGECEMALAGGVSIQAPLKEGYVYREGEVMSPDGHCRAFDAQAKGTVAGTGIGLVVLKRLSEALRDGDNICATIKGSAINNDGSLKVGYTAPSSDGQAEVITKALTAAGVHPETISYIEAHGTGTVLGDPIEIEGLTKAFRACGVQQNGYCAVGSVKTNIGHLDTAAGVAGLLKTVLALQHKRLLASLNSTSPNPRIDFANSPFFVNTGLTDWSVQHGRRRAGVSSFGVGGTNAHVILEEAPVAEGSGPTRPYQLLVLSARSRSSLQGMTERLLAHLKQQPDINLADVAYTLQVGRKEFEQRRMLLCGDVEGAIQALEQADPQRLQTDQAVEGRSIVFLFPGQGSQYVNMARELYETEPVFRSHVDHCAQLLEPELGRDLRHVLFPADEQREAATTQLNETWLTQPALFVIEYALATLWQSWGVHPQAMIGHSIGEYVAACLAGVFTVEDALALVATRGRLIQNCPKGSMLAVSLSEQETRSLLSDDVAIAAINGLRSTVVSGPDHAIVALQERLARQGTLCRRLHTSHAFHSAMMESILEPFKAQLRKVKLVPPQVPFLSNKTGTWITKEEATDPGYWAQHLRSTVRFADGLNELFVDAGRVFLEVGPGNTLSTLTRQHPLKGPTDVVISSLRHPREEQSDLAVLLQALGHLWLSGVHVDWAGFSYDEKRHRVPLPTYPFERQRYWVDAPRIRVVEEGNAGRAISDTQSLGKSQSCSLPEQHDAGRDVALPTNEFEEMIAQVWRDVLGISHLGIHDNFFELGGDSLMMARVTNRLRELLPFDIPLSCIFEAPTTAGLARRIEDMLVEHLDATHEEVPQTDLIEDSL